MEDLSHLATQSLAVSSMSGGNTVSSNDDAMSAPGSPPVEPVPDAGGGSRDRQSDPSLHMAAKPRSVLTQGGGYAPSPPRWKETVNG